MKCHNCGTESPEIKLSVFQCPNPKCQSRFTI